MSQSRGSSIFRTVSTFILAVLVVSGGIWVFNNQSVVADQIRIWQYTPSESVVTLADNVNLTDLGNRYIRASRTEIDTKTNFGTHCGSMEKGITVLGCYTQSRIYIYQVSDSRLAGVEETTVSHEMLHAAYDRLSSGDKTKVDAMLMDEYTKLKGNADFTSRFSVYDNLAESDRLNELHSVIGTEVHSLSSDLEAYYSKYFTDRQKIVNYHDAYIQPFNDIKSKQSSLKSEIDQLETSITAAQRSYTDSINGLNASIAAFNSRAASGTLSQDQFNSQRAALMAQVNQLAAQREKINSDVDLYNSKIKEYNQLSLQTEDLQHSLDSTSAAPPTI